MGKYKELKEKVAKGEATEDEIKELEEIEEDIKDADEEKTLDDATEKLLASLEKRNQEMIEKIIGEKTVEKDTKAGFAAEYAKMSDDEKCQAFYKALLRNDVARLKVMSVNSDDDGGYLVPTVLADRIVEEMMDAPTIRKYATVIPNCPATFQIDRLVGRPKSKFRAEKALKDTSSVTYTQIALTPYSLACIVPMTNELIEDAEAGGFIVTQVTRLMSESIMDREDQAFAVGTGTNEPTGINAYSGTVSRTVTAPANTAAADPMVEAELKLGAGYRRNAKWLMNTMTLTLIRKLKDGENRYLFNSDPTKEFAGTILGYPVIENNYLPKGVVWFGDISGYWIGDRGGLKVAKSEDATLTGVGNLFEQNMTAIRVEKRVDGEMADPAAFVYISGMN